MNSRPTVWVMSDGKAGHRNQSLGITDALGVKPHIIELRRRPLTGLLERLHPTWGMADVAELKTTTPPDILIATGTHLAPISAWFKRQHPQTKVVQVMPADFGSKVDLPVALTHDTPTKLKHQLTINTAPHRVTTAKLHAAHEEWRGVLKPYPAPRLGVLVGGSNKTVKFDQRQAVRLAGAVLELAAAQNYKSILITTSRRTGAAASAVMREVFRKSDLPVMFYDPVVESHKPNPYLAILANSDGLVVTAESFSMVSEALSSGKPTYLFGLKTWRLGKFAKVWRKLKRQGLLASVFETDKVPLGKIPNSADEVAARLQKLLD